MAKKPTLTEKRTQELLGIITSAAKEIARLRKTVTESVVTIKKMKAKSAVKRILNKH